MIERQPALAVLAAAILWGMLGIFGKRVLELGVAPLEIAFWRALGAGALFGIHAMVTRVRWPRGPDLASTAVFGIVGVSVFYGAYQLAIETGGASLASVLLYTAPAFVAIAAKPFLHESLGRREVIGVIATIAGVSVVSLAAADGIRASVSAVGFGVIAGATYALYYIWGKRAFVRHAPAALYAVAMPVGALGLAPFVSLGPRPAEAWLLLTAMAVLSTYLAYLLYAAGLRHLPATRASVIASIEPIVAVTLAAIIFGEQLAPLAYLGSAIVIASAVLLATRRRSVPPAGKTAASPPRPGLREIPGR